MLIAVVDGLKGFPDAINAVFPETVMQTCTIHLIRNAMNFAFWKDRKAFAQSLRSVYRVDNADAGLTALKAFEEGHWGQKCPSSRGAGADTGNRHWEQVTPFFAFSVPVQGMIYTTNAIEALNAKLRRAVRTCGYFPGDFQGDAPSEEAAMTLLYLVLNHAAEQGKRPPREGTEAKTQFAIIFGGRSTL